MVMVNLYLEEAALFEAGVEAFYGTMRLRFTVLINNLHIPSSVFIKVPQLGEWFVIGTKLQYFQKERYMYETILPLLQKNWRAEKFSPHFYGSTKSGVLVIENLREFGLYTLEEPQDKMVTCIQVFKSLAQFHALSVAYVDEFNYETLDLLTVRNRSYFEGKEYDLQVTLLKFLERVRPLFSEDIEKELAFLGDNLLTIVNEAYSPNENGLNVILHGEMSWMSVFFQNDKQNNVVHCKFVDFINSRRGSPVIDLVNYLLTSVQFEVYRVYGNKLFQFYVEELKKAVDASGTDIQSLYGLNELYADLQKYKHFFVFQLIFYVPQYWNFRSNYFAQNEEDTSKYDLLMKSEDYITFFKSWIEVIILW